MSKTKDLKTKQETRNTNKTPKMDWWDKICARHAEGRITPRLFRKFELQRVKTKG